ncbi:MAG: alpha-glucan family phosphorylase [Deltaproteobacteria bacterium]|nr:alpha-glucan family phosphorylase [bacterium]MCB9489386.1 alpha-glucan family phosphorylase [Deltaproteobacteria bacterium]
MKPVLDIHVAPSIPEELRTLGELAYNLWWSWNYQAVELFRRIDAELWEETHHNPVELLGKVRQRTLDRLARDEGFLGQLRSVYGDFRSYMTGKTWHEGVFGPGDRPKFAYFSMEYGLTEALRIYSGGLGVLAGDHLKSASDLGVPLVAVGLAYQRGYFRQYLNADGWQQETYPMNNFYTLPMEPVLTPNGQPLMITLKLFEQPLQLRVWRVAVGRVDLFLLDSDVEGNTAEAREITAQLYGGDNEMRIQQEIILGIGGYRVLDTLGKRPATCHMNEGHSAFLSLEKVRLLMLDTKLNFDDARVACAGSNVFTTHTPVPAGFDKFSRPLMEKYFHKYIADLGISMEQLVALGQGPDDGDMFNMAVFAMANTSYVNAVSKLHAEVTKEMVAPSFPDVPVDEVPIQSITNGIHIRSWTTSEMGELYRRYMGDHWYERVRDSEDWAAVEQIPDTEIWRTHVRERERLISFIRRRLEGQLLARNASKQEIDRSREVLDPRALTIGFARRFATYKRATLLLRDTRRLERILLDPERPIQFVFAGKAHPADDGAKELIKQLIQFAKRPGMREKIVFIEDYDILLARYMISGVDLWLNNPRRPMEASGTSGMKVLANGGLNCSVLDGWWPEAYGPDVGWAIGAGESYQDLAYQDLVESNALYDLLEQEIVPAFYQRSADDIPRRWISMIKASIRRLCPVFNTDRMVRQYTERFYHPAEHYGERLAADSYTGAKTYAHWQARIRQHWHETRIDNVHAEERDLHYRGDEIRIQATVTLGALTPDDVHLEIYAGEITKHDELARGMVTKMEKTKDLGKGKYLYEGIYNCSVVGRQGIAVRVTPMHELSVGPYVLPHIRWAEPGK